MKLATEECHALWHHVYKADVGYVCETCMVKEQLMDKQEIQIPLTEPTFETDLSNPYGGTLAFVTKDSGKKNDAGKSPIALVSPDFIIEVAKVLDFGQQKYAAWNWKGGFAWSRVISAVLRHIFAWLRGEDKDPETGLSHLAHAACGLMFLIDFEVNKLGTDDRYKNEETKKS